MIKRFEPNEAITRYVDALVAACRDLNRDDILPHDTIRSLLGVEPHRDHWQTCVVKLKRRLEVERGISLWPEVGIGYRLLSKDHQLTMLPLARARRAKRQLRLATRSVVALPDSDLSVTQRRLKWGQVEALRTAQQQADTLSDRMAALSRPVADQVAVAAARAHAMAATVG